MEAGEVGRVRESSGSSERTRCNLCDTFFLSPFVFYFLGPFSGPNQTNFKFFFFLYFFITFMCAFGSSFIIHLS